MIIRYLDPPDDSSLSNPFREVKPTSTIETKLAFQLVDQEQKHQIQSCRTTMCQRYLMEIIVAGCERGWVTSHWRSLDPPGRAQPSCSQALVAPGPNW